MDERAVGVGTGVLAGLSVSLIPGLPRPAPGLVIALAFLGAVVGGREIWRAHLSSILLAFAGFYTARFALGDYLVQEQDLTDTTYLALLTVGGALCAAALGLIPSLRRRPEIAAGVIFGAMAAHIAARTWFIETATSLGPIWFLLAGAVSGGLVGALLPRRVAFLPLGAVFGACTYLVVLAHFGMILGPLASPGEALITFAVIGFLVMVGLTYLPRRTVPA